MKNRIKYLLKKWSLKMSWMFMLSCGAVDEMTFQLKDDVGSPLPTPVAQDRVEVTVFSEAGFWGRTYTTRVQSFNKMESSLFVPTRTLSSRNLVGAISSARIKCFNREADVFFFDGRQLNTEQASWNSRIVAVPCQPGETVELNFHQIRRNPGNVSMGDRITAFLILLHAKNRVAFDFSRGFSNQWNNVIKRRLPNQAKLDGVVDLTFRHKRGFALTQRLKLDGGILCPEGKARFTYEFAFYVNKSFPGQPISKGIPVWRIVESGTKVDGGWYCQNQYETELKKAVKNAEAELLQKLNALNFGAKETYYLSPNWDSKAFYLNYSN